MHARKLILKGIVSKGDKKVPPLRYDYVDRITRDLPNLSFVLNGGVRTIQECQKLFQKFPLVKGIMIGRAVCQNPLEFANIDSLLYCAPD